MELSGTLRREGHGAVIISQSAAEAKKKRYERIHAKAVALFERQEKSKSNGQGDGFRAASPVPSPQSAPVEQVLELPPSTPDAPDEAERIAAALRQMSPGV